jgi:hypothetical protein
MMSMDQFSSIADYFGLNELHLLATTSTKQGSPLLKILQEH